MVRSRRNFVPGATYFFTVVLADRRQHLLTDRIDALGSAFRACREIHPFETIAIAVLPDHLHCVWTLPAGDADYPNRWNVIKRAFTRKQLREGPTSPRGGAKIWQPRCWEHTVRDEADLERCVAYIHHNPLAHGHVASLADWPHSSFHRYVRAGWLSPDWVSEAAADPADYGDA